MQHQRSYGCALAGFMVCSAHLIAQTTPISTTEPGVTTGMVGLAPSQTARINVLNLNPMAGTPVICSVQLQFVNPENSVLKQAIVANIPPGQAAALELKREEIADMTTLRQSIRGVVRNPLGLPPVASGAAPIAVPPACTIMTTLELFDDLTGVTHVVTAATRPLPAGPIPVPTPAH
jgi:hypothetical protein